MLWWLQTIFAASALIYLFTFLIGLLGNAWVIASLFRTGKKATFASGKSLSPSDRLRKYIWLLSLLDLSVNGSLCFRVWHLLFSDRHFSPNACRWAFAVDQSLKLCSLTCLACISIERFITIRKPFNNKVRKVAVQLTPLFALLSLLFCGGAILWLCVNFVGTTDDGMNCTQRYAENNAAKGAHWTESSVGQTVARTVLAVGFFVQLGVIESNYARIVFHVKRKFWQRKARAVANSVPEKCSRQPNCASPTSVSGGAQQCVCGRPAKSASPSLLLVQMEPRYPHYMREMTTTIRRIAVFHLICWLPYCLLSFLSSDYPVFHADLRVFQVRAIFAVRIVDGRQHNLAAWAAFVVNWLTYCNSAGNWVLYAALNRDLRSIIKACSERRKRSTMSHHQQQQSVGGTIGHPSPTSGMFKRSVRRGALQSLRFFYSLNSHHSSAASIDADFGEVQSVATTVGQLHNGRPSSQPNASPCSPRTSLRAPSVLRKQSSVSGEASPKRCRAEDGIFGWRDGRAYSYCGPTTPSGDPLLERSATPSPLEKNTLFGYRTMKNENEFEFPLKEKKERRQR
ncbi:hypothetical protein niasHT_022604 [Heterodera trifolii]|uniref:G-protein coupled receptors family 1 profile domain-containing protein n=1 Tax=Heterodera trifolii TaxID=157864 RepID=A0ABD2JRE6_9BILA